MGFQPYGSFIGQDAVQTKFAVLSADTFYLSREMLLLDKAVIRSNNFVEGSSGFILRYDGSVELNDVVVRGDLSSGNWDGSDPANLATWDTGASAGYYLDASVGSMQLMGDLWLGGTLTTGNDDGSGSPYISIGEDTAANYIKWYSNITEENMPSQLWDAVAATGNNRFKSISLYTGTLKANSGIGHFYAQSESIVPGFYAYAQIAATNTSGGRAELQAVGGATPYVSIKTHDGTNNTSRILLQESANSITFSGDSLDFEDITNGHSILNLSRTSLVFFLSNAEVFRLQSGALYGPVTGNPSTGVVVSHYSTGVNPERAG